MVEVAPRFQTQGSVAGEGSCPMCHRWQGGEVARAVGSVMIHARVVCWTERRQRLFLMKLSAGPLGTGEQTGQKNHQFKQNMSQRFGWGKGLGSAGQHWRSSVGRSWHHRQAQLQWPASHPHPTRRAPRAVLVSSANLSLASALCPELSQCWEQRQEMCPCPQGAWSETGDRHQSSP